MITDHNEFLSVKKTKFFYTLFLLLKCLLIFVEHVHWYFMQMDMATLNLVQDIMDRYNYDTFGILQCIIPLSWRERL
jgi:hypothetical protein